MGMTGKERKREGRRQVEIESEQNEVGRKSGGREQEA